MAETKKVRVLTVGDSPYTSTGYGTVWFNLLSRWTKLKPDWEFYHINWQSRERKHKTDLGHYHLPVGKLEYGYDSVREHINSLKPDFVITLADVGWQSGYRDIIFKAKQEGWEGKWIMYTPIDTHAWALTWTEIFNGPDINVAMAGFGKRRMLEQNIPNVQLINHGVDLETFYPMEAREVLRDMWKVNDKFVVGFVGRNQTRKRLDILLKTFAEFAKDKDDVLLMLHTDREPPQHGWSMPYLIWQNNLQSKVRLTKEDLDIDYRQKVSPNIMNELYNLFDVFLYTTGGEGFGLPGIEAQASGVPLLMTSCTTAEDICYEEDRIPVLKDINGNDVIDVGTNGVYFMTADYKKGAEMLERYYQQWKEKSIDRNKPLEMAKKYDWGPISEQWIKLFEDNLT